MIMKNTFAFLEAIAWSGFKALAIHPHRESAKQQCISI